jgi:hypothetical protein
MTSVAFRLMFGFDEIGHLADGYLAKYKAADDEAVEAGRKIRERDYRWAQKRAEAAKAQPASAKKTARKKGPSKRRP